MNSSTQEPTRASTAESGGVADNAALGDAARDMARRAGAEGSEKVGEYRAQAADTVDQLADSVDKVAADLADGDDALHLSRHLAELAGSMHAVSRSVKEKSADALLGDVTRIARESPALFLGGAAALGFALTRLLKASAHGSSQGTSSHATGTPDDSQDDGDASGQPSSGRSFSSGTAGAGTGAATYGSPSPASAAPTDEDAASRDGSGGNTARQGSSPGAAGVYGAPQTGGAAAISSSLTGHAGPGGDAPGRSPP